MFTTPMPKFTQYNNAGFQGRGAYNQGPNLLQAPTQQPYNPMGDDSQARMMADGLDKIKEMATRPMSTVAQDSATIQPIMSRNGLTDNPLSGQLGGILGGLQSDSVQGGVSNNQFMNWIRGFF